MSDKAKVERDGVLRCQFLGGVAAGAALPSAAQAATTTKISAWDTTTDIVVVGSGPHCSFRAGCVV